MDVQKSFERITQWQSERERRMKDVEDSICKELDEASDKILRKLKKVNSEIDNYLNLGVDPISNKMESAQKYCDRREDFILREIKRIEKYVKGGNLNPIPEETQNEENLNVGASISLQQAVSYRIIDRILFSITEGEAPDFTLMSQSVLFETVYPDIYRNSGSHLLQDIPQDAVNLIYKGREFLLGLRDQEERYLDKPELWDVYAPKVQTWWTETALPMIYGVSCEGWVNVAPATHEKMQQWEVSEFSKMVNFPEVYDLITLANKRTEEVRNHVNLSKITSL